MITGGLHQKSGASNEYLEVSNENMGFPMKIWGLQRKSTGLKENLCFPINLFGSPMKIWGSATKIWGLNEKLGLINEMVLMIGFYKAKYDHYP